MTRLKKIAEFNDFEKFEKLLNNPVIKIGRFGGLKVSLKVTVKGQKCIVSVSRNQLAKLALSLAKKNKDDKDVAESFSQLKKKLSTLEKRKTPGRLSKRLGNFIFKVLHFGKDRTRLLRRKEIFLQLNKSSSDSSSTDEPSESKTVSRSESSKSMSDTEPQARKKPVSSESHSESEEWEPPKDKNAPVNLEKYTLWLAKNGYMK